MVEREREQYKQEQLRARQEDSNWKNRCTKLETELTTLRQLGTIRQANSETAVNSQLKEKLTILTVEKDELEQKLAESARTLEREKDAEVLRLDTEKLRLESDLRNLQNIISSHQENVAKLQEQHSQSQSEIKHLKSNIESLEGQMTCRETEVHSLKQKQEEEKVDKEQSLTAATHADIVASLTEVKGQLGETETQLMEVTVERDRVGGELVRTREAGGKTTKKLLQLKAHLLEVCHSLEMRA